MVPIIVLSGSKIATIDYTYDLIHQLNQISQSGSNVVGQVIDFDYDNLNQLTKVSRSISNNLTTSVITEYQYQ
jgi:hypothetical protein